MVLTSHFDLISSGGSRVSDPLFSVYTYMERGSRPAPTPISNKIPGGAGPSSRPETSELSPLGTATDRLTDPSGGTQDP